MYSRLATEEESQALIESARIAAQPAQEPNSEDLGRGKRKRPEQGLAEMGKRAFKRMLREGQLAVPSGPSGLRTVSLLS